MDGKQRTEVVFDEQQHRPGRRDGVGDERRDCGDAF
jgi:hypothetical protein